jgi:hypothetical protein
VIFFRRHAAKQAPVSRRFVLDQHACVRRTQAAGLSTTLGPAVVTRIEVREIFGHFLKRQLMRNNHRWFRSIRAFATGQPILQMAGSAPVR